MPRDVAVGVSQDVVGKQVLRVGIPSPAPIDQTKDVDTLADISVATSSGTTSSSMAKAPALSYALTSSNSAQRARRRFCRRHESRRSRWLAPGHSPTWPTTGMYSRARILDRVQRAGAIERIRPLLDRVAAPAQVVFAACRLPGGSCRSSRTPIGATSRYRGSNRTSGGTDAMSIPAASAAAASSSEKYLSIVSCLLAP